MTWRRLFSPAFLLAVALLLGGAVGLRAAVSAMGIYLRKLPIQPAGDEKFHTLSNDAAEANGWKYVPSPSDKPLSQEIVETLGTQNYVSRQFVKKFGEKQQHVELHCAYYTGTIDIVPHVPENCFVGGGMMQTSNARVIRLPLDMTRYAIDREADPKRHGGPVFATYDSRGTLRRMPRGLDNIRMTITRFAEADRELYAGYFFIANGGTAPGANDVRLLAFDLTDDYAYYTKVQVTSNAVKSHEELAVVAADLLDAIFPEIMRRVPDWIEVVEGRYPPDNPRGEAPRAAGATTGPTTTPQRP